MTEPPASFAAPADPAITTTVAPTSTVPVYPVPPGEAGDETATDGHGACERREAYAGLLISGLNLLVALAALYVTWSGFQSVSHQIHQSQATLILETADKIYVRMHEIHGLFLEHPELRQYFYGGRDNLPAAGPEDQARHERVAQAAEMLCDFFHQALIQIDTVPQEDRFYRADAYRDLHDGWACYMKDVWKTSPALRAHYSANRSWYTSNTLSTRIFGAAERERLGEEPPSPECAVLASPMPPAGPKAP